MRAGGIVGIEGEGIVRIGLRDEVVADLDLRVEWLAWTWTLPPPPRRRRSREETMVAEGCVTRKDRVFTESSSFVS